MTSRVLRFSGLSRQYAQCCGILETVPIVQEDAGMSSSLAYPAMKLFGRIADDEWSDQIRDLIRKISFDAYSVKANVLDDFRHLFRKIVHEIQASRGSQENK